MTEYQKLNYTTLESSRRYGVKYDVFTKQRAFVLYSVIQLATIVCKEQLSEFYLCPHRFLLVLEVYHRFEFLYVNASGFQC